MGRVGVSVRPAFGGGHFYHCLPAAAASRGESRVVPRWERRRTGIEGRSRACDVLTASGKARCARFEACLLTPSLPLSVQSLGAGAPPATSNVNSLSPRRSDEDATTTRPKRCSAVNLRDAQDSAVPNGKHASDEPLTRSRLFTSAPVARSAAGEIRAVPGRRLETRVARRAGLDTNCPYEKHSWSNSWSNNPCICCPNFIDSFYLKYFSNY